MLISRSRTGKRKKDEEEEEEDTDLVSCSHPHTQRNQAQKLNSPLPFVSGQPSRKPLSPFPSISWRCDYPEKSKGKVRTARWSGLGLHAG
ncbi:uncharacterized [Tachysurus ichikawai]